MKKGPRPEKPYAAYPLHAHASGQWSARINGKARFFGVWADPKGALAKYLAYMNGTPVVSTETVGARVDSFRDDKQAQLDSGDITQVTLDEYETASKVIESHFGRGRATASIEESDLRELRVALSKGKKKPTLGPHTLKRRLIIARMVFPEAAKSKHLKIPSKRALRAAKAARGKQLYTAAEIRALVKGAHPSFKWLVLLGINCGFGPRDCELFPGPDGEWHNFARPKTGIERRCWLWPETVEALKAQGGEWNRYLVAREFAALCDVCEVSNRGFYSLKRTFVTVAKGSQAVIDRICGWARNDMATIYRQDTFDEDLRACSEGVRAWYLDATAVQKAV
jgi:integrase